MTKPKLLFLLLFLPLALGAKAEYAAMEFITNDGQRHEVKAEGLVITTSGDELIASDGDRVLLVLKLSSVTSMELIRELGSAEDIRISDDGPVTFYTTDGKTAGTFETVESASLKLESGIYIIKNKSGETFKILIGK